MNVIDNTPEGVGIVLSQKEYEWLLSAVIFYGNSNPHTILMAVCDKDIREKMATLYCRAIEGWNEIYKSPEVKCYMKGRGL